MRKLLLTVVALSILTTATAVPAQSKEPLHFKASNAWIKLWDKRDKSIYPSMKVASNIFRVSYNTLDGIQGGEGGNVHRDRLHVTLCSPYALGSGGGGGVGWNNSGSYAFGPMQFMMGSKPACHSNWGTFGAYDDRAFKDAKSRGVPIPYRFKTPASNVGQAIVTAYMVSIGGLCVHWSASMC